MRRALELAEKGKGTTSPNPMVGAVVVKSDRIVGEGFHRRAGGFHAEVIALKKAGDKAHGGTLYLNLEPCCHLDKKTPPCVPLIIRRKVRRVVIGMRDPNSKVNGKGIELLRRSGIEVTENVLKDDSLLLNEVYRKFVTSGLPFVISKAAVTLDGKIAFRKGSTSRITGKEAGIESHRLRNQSDAILVGIQTILTDDPRLTVRWSGGIKRDPIRIVVDSTLKIPLHARILTQKSDAKTIVATTRHSRPKKIRALAKSGVLIWIIKDHQGRVSLPHLMTECGRYGISSILIEGGGELNASAFRSGVVDKLVWFIAPTLIGGNSSVSVLAEEVGSWQGRGIGLRALAVKPVGKDIRVEGYL